MMHITTRTPLFITSLLFSSVAFGHGYVLDSRAKLCADGVNTGCGSVSYEPQSVEGADRFPATGPADGTLAAAGLAAWSQLNEQTPVRWHKVNRSPGTNEFSWRFTAPHSSRDWRYFITKADWDSARPLSRDSFELTPFCEYSGNNQRPPFNITHVCNVPERTGYQVILAVWDVADTAASFYNVIDVQMSGSGGGTNPPPATDELIDVGDINPSQTLKAGDRVQARVFTAQGEQAGRSVNRIIASNEEGDAQVWPKLLADTINQNSADLKAGLKNAEGNVVPAFGKNDIFVTQSSDVVRVEISVSQDQITPTLSVSLHEDTYTANEPFSLMVHVMNNSLMTVTADLYAGNVAIAHAEKEVSGADAFYMDIAAQPAGTYSLVVKGETPDGQFVQATATVTVEAAPVNPGTGTGDVSVYPEGRGSYVAGSRIVGLDGKIYRCTIAGWCNGSGSYYSPGTGLAWSSAWEFTGEQTDGSAVPQQTTITYPENRGNYAQGDLVAGSNGGTYRCNIPGWCNSNSDLYYAPGTGLAWQGTWTKIAD